MTETKDNSSLPLLLSITGAVLAVAIGGWYLLNQESAEPVANTRMPAPETAPAIIAEEPETDGAETTDEVVEPDVDAELRKARLAADADILVLPANQSALHYYSRVLKGDPQHEVAVAELDAILARVAQTVRQHLAAEEFDDAYRIAVLVAKQQPEHELVIETQRTLDARTEQLVAQAIQHAQDGDDEQAEQILAAAQSLPGRNPDYFRAIRESIGEVRDVRHAAERDRVQRAQMANDEARVAWVKRIRAAISEGKLISPAGASARDLLAERNKWTAERNKVTSELSTALIDTAQSFVNDGRLDEAEAMLSAALDIGGNPDELQQVRISLDNALIEAESNRVAHMRELVQVKTASPRYPRRAVEREESGWVDVYFTVATSGETVDIEVNRSEPKVVFDRAAIEAVAKWAFQPVEFRGRVINQRAAARLVFRLE